MKDNLARSPHVSGGAPVILQDPRRGFRNYGEFAWAVANKGERDERLRIIAAAPSTFGSELAGADGGFAVPPTFAEEIFLVVYAGDSLMPLCDDQKTSGNSMIFPIDQDPPWTPPGGVNAYWQAEAGAATQSKPQLTNGVMRLNKLIAFVPVSNELVEDAAALESYLPGKSADVISWRFNQAILQGNGNGQPNGILGCPATVIQAKDTGQTTGTVSITNATNMLARLPPGSHGRAVFVTNVSTLPQLTSLGAGASGYGMTYDGDYVPGTRIPIVGRLVGRPVIPTAHLPAVGTQGDLTLLDLKYYRVLTRPGGIESAWSFHLYFDADVSAFRATFRCDGQPLIRAPIPAVPGGPAATFSPFIQLAARP